jgi:hypothetical protein
MWDEGGKAAPEGHAQYFDYHPSIGSRPNLVPLLGHALFKLYPRAKALGYDLSPLRG